jgi:hypothetical protein
MKSILPSAGTSNGCQASCVGEIWTFGFTGRKFDSMSGLSGISVYNVVRTLKVRNELGYSQTLHVLPLDGLDIAMIACLRLEELQRRMPSFVLHRVPNEHILDYSVPVV